MKEIKSTLEYGGKKFVLTWMPYQNLSDLKPIDQTYGIVFNKDGDILVCRAKREDNWQIPGGKPENNETWEQALSRELQEEVDVTVTDITPLGAQKVEQEIEGTLKLSSYQLRYIALLDKLLDQTIDPDVTVNSVWERKFVPADEIKSYIKWGEVGNAMFDDAIDLFNAKKLGE